MNQLFQRSLNNKAPKILALAFNYGKPQPTPVYFSKFHSSITLEQDLHFPPELTILHELELGVLIGKGGKAIRRENSYEHIGGYFLCFDLTDKSLLKLRELQYPWESCKSLDDFLPIGRFIEKREIADPMDLKLRLTINDKEIYSETTQNMCYGIAEQIEFISRYTTLNEGDLILTGTPKNGRIERSSVVKGELLQKDQLVDKLQVTVN